MSNANEETKTPGSLIAEGLSCCLERKDINGAIAQFSSAIALQPKNVSAYRQRAKAFVRKREYQNAIVDFDQAIALAPADSATFYFRGRTWHLLENTSRAIADYDNAIRLDPKNIRAVQHRNVAIAGSGSSGPSIVTETPKIFAWHYIQNGAKKGPVSAALIKSLLEKKAIEPDTHVWRKGMTDWKSIRETDLAGLVASLPPVISPQLIGDGYAWTLALLPLVWALIDASISIHNKEAIAAGAFHEVIKEFPPLIPLIANCVLVLLDFLRLRRAGYRSKWLVFAGFVIVPLYLFVRAARLRQTPWYAICWIVTFLIDDAVW
jgi:tetratricopeptide (TPR) repeat protein